MTAGPCELRAPLPATRRQFDGFEFHESSAPACKRASEFADLVIAKCSEAHTDVADLRAFDAAVPVAGDALTAA